MAFQTNPFLERASEQTTSDLDFVRLFSPKVLEKLPDDAFSPGVHIFYSAPGAGKTTLMRAFTPPALRGIWSSKSQRDLSETFQRFVKLGVLDSEDRPEFLGVYLSCASGYSDLPPAGTLSDDGAFRALFDCRVVIRTLRGVAQLLGVGARDSLERVQLEYPEELDDLKHIPQTKNAKELIDWASTKELSVYSILDGFYSDKRPDLPVHYRFESPIWLSSIKFVHDGMQVAANKLLMVDDLHKLRAQQRSQLLDELTVQRSPQPIWLAQRSIVLGEKLLSQGSREGRDIREHHLETLWAGTRGAQFNSFIQSIVDRRMMMQDTVRASSFTQCLQSQLSYEEIKDKVDAGILRFSEKAAGYSDDSRYREWLDRARKLSREASVETLEELFVTSILVARDKSKRQLSLEMVLGEEELEDRDSPQLRAAAQILMHHELKIPFYFGFDRLCSMGTSNIEELLGLAAALYEGLRTKQVLRKPEVGLSPVDQEKILIAAARKKYDFIPRNHTNGSRAQRLIDSIGALCQSRTFLPNAPYAPGVTGVRLSHKELNRLEKSQRNDGLDVLRAVLSECLADNLLVMRDSKATTNREGGSVFYLNRTLCAHYGLPLQFGGWQETTVTELVGWLERVPPVQNRSLELV